MLATPKFCPSALAAIFLSVAVGACLRLAPEAEISTPPAETTDPSVEDETAADTGPEVDAELPAATDADVNASDSDLATDDGPESASSGDTGGDDTANTDGTVDYAPATVPPVGTFTTDQLFAAGKGGCGMSLWRTDTSPREDGFIFFSGLDGMATMRIDGELMELERDSSTGDEFYGQYTSQTFVGPDDSLSATVNVTLGEPGEIESVAIPAGTLLMQSGGEVREIAVKGDAGC